MYGFLGSYKKMIITSDTVQLKLVLYTIYCYYILGTHRKFEPKICKEIADSTH